MPNQKSIISIGFDLVPTQKFAKLVAYKKQQSWRSFFFADELRYCFSKTKPEIHLAVRFAAKEAVIKAYTQLRIAVQFKDIKISILDNHPHAAVLLPPPNQYETYLSLSHTQEIAAAIAWVSL